MNWLQYNPKSYILKKYFYGLLKEKYPPFDDLVERLSYALPTEGDMTRFNELIKEVYLAGFNQAIDSYKDELKRLGLNVEITNPSQKSQG